MWLVATIMDVARTDDKEFPLWLSSNKPNLYPRGLRFALCHHSVDEGSDDAVSCSVGCRCPSVPALL